MRGEPLVSLTLPSEDHTRALGARMNGVLSAGDVICLVGDIGAGKSVLARAIIQTRLSQHGRLEDVPSPTFTLVQTYETPDLEIWHCDLYRLSSADETLDLGLEDAFETAACLIEWPDRLGDAVPDKALILSLKPDENGARHLSATSAQPDLWQGRLSAIAGLTNA